MKIIFRYLRGTSDLVLCYQNGDLRLRGYSNADWGGDLDGSKSTLGYVFTLLVELYLSAIKSKTA